MTDGQGKKKIAGGQGFVHPKNHIFGVTILLLLAVSRGAYFMFNWVRSNIHRNLCFCLHPSIDNFQKKIYIVDKSMSFTGTVDIDV